MARRGDEVVGHVAIIGLRQIPVTRCDQRRRRIVRAVPGLRATLTWLNLSVPITRGHLDAWLGPIHRQMAGLGRKDDA